ncbi:MAG: cobyrinate a,c-diamide synthase [Acidimicrobiales bacterium]
MIAGTSSGVGKTTVTSGLMRLLASRGGLSVGAAKVGPDFIDPGYHRIATGSASRNLDPFLSGPDQVPIVAWKAGAGRDILVIEGVMGLFDGALLEGAPPTSTAAVAAMLGAPIVLVVDASGMSTSIAAVASGYRNFATDVEVAGVIVNRVASPSHGDATRAALEAAGIPLFGMIPRDQRLHFESRHLGLIPVVESPEKVSADLDCIASVLAESLDVDALVRLARSARAIDVSQESLEEVEIAASKARVGILSGSAFSFVYPDNAEALVAQGAELIGVDPLSEETLPSDLDALYLPGGFPEVFAAQLSANRRWLDELAALVDRGVPTWAECGGLLVLADSLDSIAMAGALRTSAQTGSRARLGYVEVKVQRQSPLAMQGQTLFGHEFHYTTTDPLGDGLMIRSRHGVRVEGFVNSSIFASYVHLHLSRSPEVARRLVGAAAAFRLAKTNS